MNETAADHYSLETVGLPDGLASALVKTAEYRDPRPDALQEALCYTHPSVERRVRWLCNGKQSSLERRRLNDPHLAMRSGLSIRCLGGAH